MSAGVKPQDVQRFRGNRFFKSAMHAAVQYLDLAPLMWQGGSAVVDDTMCSLPCSKQVLMPSNTCKRAQPGCRSGCCCCSFFSCQMTYCKAAKHACPGIKFAHMSAHISCARDEQSRSCAAQVRCVEILLRAGAAMTQEQLTIVLHTLPALESPRVCLFHSNSLPVPSSSQHET